MSLNRFVDSAVDKAAAAAKLKVKSMLGGGSGGDAKKPHSSGGIGDLFPSAGESGSKHKEKKGGLFGGLFTQHPDGMNSGAGGGAGGYAGGGDGGYAAGGGAGGYAGGGAGGYAGGGAGGYAGGGDGGYAAGGGAGGYAGGGAGGYAAGGGSGGDPDFNAAVDELCNF